jgi:23S rRNA (uridine2552-2'-O)-methyltransferase
VDLCCGPGSWLQVVQQICSQDCQIIGIDSVNIQPLEGVEFIQCTIDDPKLVPLLRKKFGSPINVVLSDCAPKLTGSKTLDRQQQLFLAETSLSVAKQLLEKKGHFVSKLFQSEQFKEYEKRLRQIFDFVKSFKPKSSFKRSPEMYFIAKGFKGNPS